MKNSIISVLTGILGVIAFMAGIFICMFVWPFVSYLTPYAEKSGYVFSGLTGIIAVVMTSKINREEQWRRRSVIITGSLIAFFGVFSIGWGLARGSTLPGDFVWSICGPIIIFLGVTSKYTELDSRDDRQQEKPAAHRETNAARTTEPRRQAQRRKRRISKRDIMLYTVWAVCFVLLLMCFIAVVQIFIEDEKSGKAGLSAHETAIPTEAATTHNEQLENSELYVSVMSKLGLYVDYDNVSADEVEVFHNRTDRSTCFSHVGYDSDHRVLSVIFRTSGAKYYYYNVGLAEYEQLMNADSMGGYYNREIKGQYRCERID